MEFGGFNARRSSLLASFLITIFSLVFPAGAQQQPSPGGVNANELPPAQPISQAALPSGSVKSEPVKNESSKGSDNGAGSSNSDATESTSSSLLKLGPGDLLEVGVYNVPELSTKARVGNSGDVYLPLIDYVHIGGLTVEEGQALIEKRLESGGFVRSPHVTIFLDESPSQGVTLLGEVVKPGIYPLLGDRRLFDVLSAAGGFTQSAGRKVSIIRQHSQNAPITVSLPRNLADDLQDDIEIFPGDTITVPRAPIIYVVGDVGRPAGLLVDNGNLTVLQALALAGGTNHTAKLSGVRIIRKGTSGMTETKVPLKRMLEAKAPDMNLQSDDILFVPLSGVRVAAAQAASAAISAGTGLAVIAAHP